MFLPSPCSGANVTCDGFVSHFIGLSLPDLSRPRVPLRRRFPLLKALLRHSQKTEDISLMSILFPLRNILMTSEASRRSKMAEEDDSPIELQRPSYHMETQRRHVVAPFTSCFLLCLLFQMRSWNLGAGKQVQGTPTGDI